MSCIVDTIVNYFLVYIQIFGKYYIYNFKWNVRVSGLKEMLKKSVTDSTKRITRSTKKLELCWFWNYVKPS